MAWGVEISSFLRLLVGYYAQLTRPAEVVFVLSNKMDNVCTVYLTKKKCFFETYCKTAAHLVEAFECPSSLTELLQRLNCSSASLFGH